MMDYFEMKDKWVGIAVNPDLREYLEGENVISGPKYVYFLTLTCVIRRSSDGLIWEATSAYELLPKMILDELHEITTYKLGKIWEGHIYNNFYTS